MIRVVVFVVATIKKVKHPYRTKALMWRALFCLCAYRYAGAMCQKLLLSGNGSDKLTVSLYIVFIWENMLFILHCSVVYSIERRQYEQKRLWRKRGVSLVPAQIPIFNIVPVSAVNSSNTCVLATLVAYIRRGNASFVVQADRTMKNLCKYPCCNS